MGEKEYSGRGVLNPLFSEKKNTIFFLRGVFSALIVRFPGQGSAYSETRCQTHFVN